MLKSQMQRAKTLNFKSRLGAVLARFPFSTVHPYGGPRRDTKYTGATPTVTPIGQATRGPASSGPAGGAEDWLSPACP
eukprot:scaffold171722_cov30-Tisochrysis_lutea.AAC.1